MALWAGELEDWRRHARAKAYSAKRQLFLPILQLAHFRHLREQVHVCTSVYVYLFVCIYVFVSTDTAACPFSSPPRTGVFMHVCVCACTCMYVLV